MIYAAWFELHNDDVIVAHPTALRVYAHLLRNPLVFMHAQPVKTWLIAQLLHADKGNVIAALNLLVARGYVIEHARGEKNVRQVTLAMERQPPPVALGSRAPNATPGSAA